MFAALMKDKVDAVEVDPQRLDRFVILRAREVAGRGRKKSHKTDGEGEPRPQACRVGFEAVQKLPRQAMEAWLLHRVDELDDIETSRAMDCSRTALGNHLKLADAIMRESLGDGLPEAIAAMQAAAEKTDAAPVIAEWKTRKRKRRMAWWIVGAVGVVILFFVMRSWWGSMFG